MALEATKRRKPKKNTSDKHRPQRPSQADQEIPTLSSKQNPRERTREGKGRDQKRNKEGGECDKTHQTSGHHSESAPTKSPPPARLLTLIDLFLTSYSLNSTSRKYTAQLASREQLDGWKVELGVELPTGFPDLVKIYEDWYKQWEQRQQSKVTCNEKPDSEDAKGAKSIKSQQLPGKATASKTESISSSGSSSKSSSDEGGSNFGNQRKKQPQKHAGKIIDARSSSISSWTSDSDADNEEEPAKAKAKVAAGKPPSASSFSNSSSPTSSSGSDSEVSTPPKPFKAIKAPSSKPAEPAAKASTDSSVTLQPTSPNKSIKRSISDSSSSSSSSSPSTSPEPLPSSVSKTKSSKRKHPSDPSSFTPPTTAIGITHPSTLMGVDSPAAKKQKTTEKPSRFQRVPHDIKIDPKLASNAYRAHDYGDRAYQDLSVVRGKGFMKEKNKKKRGSYRGGTIDVSGGKGIKFD